jgi:hypothetical protein
MSDAFRKDTHTKLGEKMRMSPLPILRHRSAEAFAMFCQHPLTLLEPQSSKSTATKIKESITGSADKVAREAQPDHTKVRYAAALKPVVRLFRVLFRQTPPE